MSSSPPRRRSQDDTSWFQDGRTSCEKQTSYFVKIRKLQEELINREQHNLINAMERLKQVSYPRRKPYVRNFELPAQSGLPSLPCRPLNARQRRQQHHNNLDLKPLRGKHILTEKDIMNAGRDSSELEEFTIEDLKTLRMMPPALNDNQIAKIVCHANLDRPSTYLLQPHLPSIPNVSRKGNKHLDNRLRLLSLASEPEYVDHSVTSVKKIHSSHSQRRDKTQNASSSHERETNTKGRKKKSVLTFDVKPNDPSIFSHCVGEESAKGERDIFTPLPPPNSRPSSTKSGQIIGENNMQDDKLVSPVEEEFPKNPTTPNLPSKEDNSNNEPVTEAVEGDGDSAESFEHSPIEPTITISTKATATPQDPKG
ncbi:predicted protein [Nematostella vectensis]|uniref:Uncharacterized protein n=1 Tax=Nematostella vectensis TaxID=45351 RepID=A7S3B2_NEMVE|nr:uncharacterized protein LOC5513648 [Nematostella vectensis]EDO41821.1 predicted protein [Nematostella vectensis]|eukprot:XP_001633884.1 predicted protein [Nematostella vectensis]